MDQYYKNIIVHERVKIIIECGIDNTLQFLVNFKLQDTKTNKHYHITVCHEKILSYQAYFVSINFFPISVYILLNTTWL